LKAGEECPVCTATLQVACDEYGQKEPRFCGIKEKYMTDPNYGSEDAIQELGLFITPEQKTHIADVLIERGEVTR
jgi:hypothetical protein